ncbi:MAG: MFS transporter [Trueperaceae bacterium]|nr:MAG: MFS transporter [Trueperaceae bacterium]
MPRTLYLSIYLPAFILAFCKGMLIPVLPLYASSFGISYGLIGLILAGEAIGMLVGDLPAGTLLRRLDRKWVMLLGLSLLIVSVLALFWAQTVWQLILFRFTAGIGTALWNISRHAFITEVTRTEARGRSIATLGGIFRLGSFAGPAVSGVVAASFGLKTPFLLYAGLAIVGALATAIFIKVSPQVSVRMAHGASNHLLELLRVHRHTFLNAGLGQLLAQMIRAGRFVILPLYAANVLGLDVQAIGWIMSLSSLIDTLMFYPAGLLMDRLGRKYAIVPSFIVQGIGMALIPLAADFGMLLVAASVVGFGNGLGSGSMMTLGADLAPKESLGEFLGVWRLIGDGGATGSPLAIGGLADALDLSVAPFVIAAFGLVAASVFAFRVPETLKRAGREH